MANIYLLGFMGSGKTCVAGELGRLLNRPVVDVDELIIQECGMGIIEIFEQKGETYFRMHENVVLQRVSRQDGAVIATGGGSILRAENRARMRETGVTVYLQVDLEELWKRLRGVTDRPLLKVGDPSATLARLFASRKSLYEQADFTVDTTRKTVPQVAQEIADVLKRAGKI